jgi:hypothetical protein
MAQSHQDDRGDFGRPAANPRILELRLDAKVKLFTTPDLIVESPGGAITFAAFRVEDKGRIEDKRSGTDVSLCLVPLAKPVAFRAAVLDAHGTIQAGIKLLHRAFTLEKKTEVLYGSGIMPVWKFKARRNEKDDRFDLFVIAQWQEWNEAGILWDMRNYLAQKSEVSLGKMSRGAFAMRFQHGLGLRYLPGYIG